MYRRFGKRLFDLTLGLAALVLLSPLLAALTLAVRLKLGSPVFFRQARPGLGRKPFTLVKFRTMTDARDANGYLLPDAVRLTRFGRFLRSSSLDELPELWNVLRGDMSLVGPRPLLMSYLERYTPEQARRHEVRPGITGWAQVNGWRGETQTLDKMEKRLEHDLYYIHNWDLFLDLRIIFLTVFGRKVRSNAY